MARLDPPFGSFIDRDRPLTFRFDGCSYRGFVGDTIASALAANNVWLLSRSFKYHRPRGAFSMAGWDANTLVQLPGEPNVSADLRALEDGMDVRPQNIAGSLRRDARRWLDWCGRFLPPGFYYRAFYRPRGAWRFWEPHIRAFAGLGEVGYGPGEGAFDKSHLFADVAVIGGGAAGMAAALEAAGAGARVALVEEAPHLGGALAWGRFAEDDEATRLRLVDLAEQVVTNPDITVLRGAVANGWFADHWIPVIQGSRLIRLRAGVTVVAAGAAEQPAVFRHNDRPGIMLGSAAQRLIRLYGVRPGRRAVVVTANGDGYGVALDLDDAGLDVIGVYDLRAEPAVDARLDAVARRNIPLRTGQTVIAADLDADGTHLGAVHIGRIHGKGEATPTGEVIHCDLACISVGVMPTAHLLLHGGARLAYDDALANFRASGLADGMFAAGAVNGHMDLEAAIADGRAAGNNAATVDGIATVADVPQPAAYNHPYPVFAHPAGKDFVDLDEDQTIGDIAHALADGFRDVELVKRYTTIGMGPSQGKHAALNAARILAHQRGVAVDEVGVTTSRPPYRPETFGHLAGRGFHPERRTALHHRHIEAGAQMMVAGTWMRPAWYGALDARDTAVAAEVNAVRNGVGVIDVSTLGGLEIRGPDAAAFLERIYTSSHARQLVGRARYVLMTDRSGAIVGDGVACRLHEWHFYVTATTGAVDGVYREMLRWHAQWQMDVDIANVTAAYAGINIAGPLSSQVLARLTDDVDLSAEAFPYMGVRQAHIAGVPVRLLRVGFVGELGYELHIPAGCAEAVWDALLQAGAGEDIRPFGVEAQRLLRLEKGHIIVGQDTDGLTFPHEAGVEWTIGLSKPYFVGKRAIEIQAARGLERKLTGFTLPAGSPLPEECHLVVRGDAIVGRVTSIALSPTLGHPIGLAYVAPDQAEPGESFDIKLGDGRRIAATSVALPFYDPGNRRQGDAA